MPIQSAGKAFGLGFTAALEQIGLLVVAGALVQAVVPRGPLGTGTSAVAGALAGVGQAATRGGPPAAGGPARGPRPPRRPPRSLLVVPPPRGPPPPPRPPRGG